MTHQRPRSLASRLRNLIHGMFAVWIRDRERQNPPAAHAAAIHQRTHHYRELKDAVAGLPAAGRSASSPPTRPAAFRAAAA